MAKKQLVQSGWIEFTGLRFAKKFASREELIREIRGFFGRRGIENFGRLRVRFSRILLKDDAFNRGRLDTDSREIRVFLKNVQGRKDFFETLFHELDHVDWNRSRSFDYTRPYEKRPHEKRARKTAKKEVARFLGKRPRFLEITRGFFSRFFP